MVQTQEYGKNEKEKHTVFSGFQRDSLLTQLVPTKKYLLSVTKIQGKTNDAQNSYKSIWSFVQIMIIRFHTELDDEVQTGGKGMHEE